MEAKYAAEEAKRKELEEAQAKAVAAKNDVFAQLEESRSGTSTIEEKLNKLESQKKDLEKQTQVEYIDAN